MSDILDFVSRLGEIVFWIGIIIAVWKHKLFSGLLPSGLTRVMYWGLVVNVVAQLALMVVR